MTIKIKCAVCGEEYNLIPDKPHILSHPMGKCALGNLPYLSASCVASLNAVVKQARTDTRKPRDCKHSAMASDGQSSYRTCDGIAGLRGFALLDACPCNKWERKEG